MSDRARYTPGPARGAEVRTDGEKWTLVLVRELRHSPDTVWQALTGDTGGTDAEIQFSTTFAFDFNPFDGVSAGQYDFIGVAIHEIYGQAEIRQATSFHVNAREHRARAGSVGRAVPGTQLHIASVPLQVTRALRLTVTPRASPARPGGETTIDVVATDPLGRPVQAEVAAPASWCAWRRRTPCRCRNGSPTAASRPWMKYWTTTPPADAPSRRGPTPEKVPRVHSRANSSLGS